MLEEGNLLSGEGLVLGGLALEMVEVESLVLELFLRLGEVLLEEFGLGVEGVELLFCVLESFAELDVLQFVIFEVELEFFLVLFHLLHSLLVPPTVVLMLVVERQLQTLVFGLELLVDLRDAFSQGRLFLLSLLQGQRHLAEFLLVHILEVGQVDVELIELALLEDKVLLEVVRVLLKLFVLSCEVLKLFR